MTEVMSMQNAKVKCHFSLPMPFCLDFPYTCIITAK